MKPITFGNLDKFKRQKNVYHIVLRGVKDGKAAEDVYEIHSVRNAIDPFNEYDKYVALASDKTLKKSCPTQPKRGYALTRRTI